MLLQEIGKPALGEYAASFERYIGLITEPDVLNVLSRQVKELMDLLADLTDEQASYRYEPNKWTVREVMGHLIDCERVFGYRALCFARGEKASLPAFDENDYAASAGADAIPLADLLDEFRNLRESHSAMFRHLPIEAWQRIGTSNGKPLSVRAVAYIIPGHVRHHMIILKERYHLRPSAPRGGGV